MSNNQGSADSTKLIMNRSEEDLYLTGIPIQAKAHGEAERSLEHRTNQISKRCTYIISHESMFKVIWDWIVLLLVLFTAIQIPYLTSFELNNERNIFDMLRRRDVDAFLIVGLLVDCMFIMDIFINFSTTYVKSSSNEVVEKPSLIAIHYLRTWFVTDLLAGVPLDWMLFNKEGSGTPTLVGLLKSARLLRLFRVARKLDRYSEYGIPVLVLLMSLFTLLAHWFACIWNGIAIYEKDNPQSWAVLQNQRLQGTSANHSNRMLKTEERYAGALYFVISTMTSVGYGNISANTVAEQTFCVLLMLFGALMYACIFGSMVAIIQRLYSKASSFHNHVNTVREFLKTYKIPDQLRKSVNSYVRREWSASRGVDISAVLQQFPDCIQADITYELYRHVFSGLKIFDQATVSCMRALAMKFRTINLQANSFFLRQGDEIDRLYILGKGSLEILIDGDVMSILAKNSVFGYDFTSCPAYPKSSANVLASNVVEIHYIPKNDMLNILKVYPKFAASFLANFKLSYNLCDEAEEGTFQTFPVKQKTHVMAIAKQALAMPIMAKWSKKESAQSSTSREKKYLKHGSVSQNPTEGDMELRRVHCLGDRDFNSPCTEHSQALCSPPTVAKHVRNRSVILQTPTSDSDNLFFRICCLENNVREFRKELNEKIDRMMVLLADQAAKKSTSPEYFSLNEKMDALA